MIVVALFRNFNSGQAGAPRAAELTELFRAHGAEAVRTVRGNGTVAVAAPDPELVVGRVHTALEVSTSWSDVALTRTLPWLQWLASRLEGIPDHTEVTCFDAPQPFPHALPWRPDGGRLTVLAADDRHAICTNDEPRTSFGTRTMERILGVPATSRSTDTMVRAYRAALELA